MSAATNIEQDIDPDLTLLSEEERAEIEREADAEIEDWSDALEKEMKRSDALANAMSLEQRLASAVAADLQPIRDRLARILQIESPDVLKAKLQAFLAELPQLLKDINADPESARVIEAIAAPALAKGLTRP